MKRLFLLGTALCVATGAFAFGGIGIGPWQRHKNQGVDAIGIHIDPSKKKADIDIVDDDSQEESCPEGLERNTDGSCTVCTNGNVYLSYMDDPCGTDTPMNQEECETGEECMSETGSDTCCVNGKCRAGIPLTFDEDLYICPPVDKKACTSNKDCESGEFCNAVDSTWSEDFPNVGTCTDIGEKDVDYVDTEIEGLGIVRKSNYWLTFWGADNWCKAQGKKLIDDISLFGCYQGEDKITNSYSYSPFDETYCCRQGVDCKNWYDYWNGNNIKEEYETFVYESYSPTMIDLRKKFGGYDSFVSAVSSYNIQKFYLSLSGGSVSVVHPSDEWGHYALCINQ